MKTDKVDNQKIKNARSSRSGGIFKAAFFFSGIIGLIFAVLYLSTGGASKDSDALEGYNSIDISYLESFDYYTPFPGEDPDPERLAENKIPDNIMKLDGTRISVTGFMMPVRVDDTGNVKEFALNGNYDRCFYGVPSQINQWIHVKMQGGASARFTHSPVTVYGTLDVGELIEDGEVISIYRLTGDKANTPTYRFY